VWRKRERDEEGSPTRDKRTRSEEARTRCTGEITRAVSRIASRREILIGSVRPGMRTTDDSRVIVSAHTYATVRESYDCNRASFFFLLSWTYNEIFVLCDRRRLRDNYYNNFFRARDIQISLMRLYNWSYVINIVYVSFILSLKISCMKLVS